MNVLITGGTDGIGRLLVQYYRTTGANVLVTGRRDRQAVPDDVLRGTNYLQADQTDSSTVEAIASALETQFGGRLDLAILNAGLGFAVDTPPEGEEDITATLQANLLFNTRLAHALQGPLEATRGHLVFIGSVAYRGAAKFPSYAASKAGLHGLARALRSEWAGRVRVSMLHPGPVRTGIHAKARFDTSRIEWMFLDPHWMAAAIVQACGRHSGNITTLAHAARLRDRVAKLDAPLRHFRKMVRA